MKRTRHTPEQVIGMLREADAMLSSGRSMAQVLQYLGVREQTFHHWRNQYGGMKSEEARRLKELEVGNARLKRLVAAKMPGISVLVRCAGTDRYGAHRAAARSSPRLRSLA
jgi:putative transposase